MRMGLLSFPEVFLFCILVHLGLGSGKQAKNSRSPLLNFVYNLDSKEQNSSFGLPFWVCQDDQRECMEKTHEHNVSSGLLSVQFSTAKTVLFRNSTFLNGNSEPFLNSKGEKVTTGVTICPMKTENENSVYDCKNVTAELYVLNGTLRIAKGFFNYSSHGPGERNSVIETQSGQISLNQQQEVRKTSSKAEEKFNKSYVWVTEDFDKGDFATDESFEGIVGLGFESSEERESHKLSSLASYFSQNYQKEEMFLFLLDQEEPSKDKEPLGKSLLMKLFFGGKNIQRIRNISISSYSTLNYTENQSPFSYFPRLKGKAHLIGSKESQGLEEIEPETPMKRIEVGESCEKLMEELKPKNAKYGRSGFWLDPKSNDEGLWGNGSKSMKDSFGNGIETPEGFGDSRNAQETSAKDIEVLLDYNKEKILYSSSMKGDLIGTKFICIDLYNTKNNMTFPRGISFLVNCSSWDVLSEASSLPDQVLVLGRAALQKFSVSLDYKEKSLRIFEMEDMSSEGEIFLKFKLLGFGAIVIAFWLILLFWICCGLSKQDETQEIQKESSPSSNKSGSLHSRPVTIQSAFTLRSMSTNRSSRSGNQAVLKF